MTHWLLVSSQDNFETSRARGFDVAGMKTRRRKSALDVKPGDTVFYYLTKVKSIGGESVVTGDMYEDREPIWENNKPDEFYPWRFATELKKARDKDDYLPVESFIQQLEYAKRWPAENWTLAFQGNVHKLSDEDYELIRGLL